MPHSESDRRVSGVLTGVDDAGIDVRTDTGVRRLAFEEISKARTVFEWGAAPKPGGKRPVDSPSAGRDRGPTGRQKEAPTQ